MSLGEEDVDLKTMIGRGNSSARGRGREKDTSSQKKRPSVEKREGKALQMSNLTLEFSLTRDSQGKLGKDVCFLLPLAIGKKKKERKKREIT